MAIRRTKIICTLGPASSSSEVVDALVREGMDVARINMSHGTHDEHEASIARVRESARKHDRPVAVLVDLQGPRIRVGNLPDPLELEVGDHVELVPDGGASPGQIPTTFPPLVRDLSPGDTVLLDDGRIELQCLESEEGDEKAVLEVIRGGVLESHKGMNVPGVRIRESSLTEKDLEDLEFALAHEADYVGLSFVRGASDVKELRKRSDGGALLVAKIEQASALEAIDEILEASDAAMVARGDLGVELPFEEVPLAQKSIIQRANAWGRPVITATQMLESMLDAPRPTRAEASDVANALLDGTDAVMLSGETATGNYPVESLQALVRIAVEIQESGLLDIGPHYDLMPEGPDHEGATPREHAIAAAALESVFQLDAPAIIVITRSGFSARLVSSYRPPVPIYAVCTEPRVHRQLAAVWGVRPALSAREEVTYEDLTEFGCRMVLEDGSGQEGDPVVVTAGIPFHVSGTTNTLRIETL
ncbi:MAG: pyruvate kinase [Longimicrobiales bacterium]|nr:pyruvate kinase [Longimicrobiales bacterium]